MRIFSDNILKAWKILKNRWFWFLLITGLFVVYAEFIFWFFSSILQHKRFELLMVIFVVIFLISRKLKYSPTQIYFHTSVCGFYLLLVSLIFFLLGKFSSIETLQILGLVITIISLFLMIAGIEMTKRIIVPIAYFLISYVIFELPVEGETISIVNYNLQLFTATISNVILRLMSVQVVQDWEYLDLPHVTLYVGPSCSGFNHIIAIFLLAIPLALTGNKRIKHQFIILSIALFIGLLINGLRVSAIALWSFLYGDVSFHGPNDIFLVVSVFILGSIILLVISFEIDQKVNVQAPRSLRNLKRKTFDPAQSMIIKIVSLSAIGLVIITILFVKVKEICLKQELNFTTQFSENWHLVEVQNIPPPSLTGKCDCFFNQLYSNDNADSITIQIIYLAKQDPEKKLTNYMPSSWTIISETVHLVSAKTDNLIINRSYKFGDPDQQSTYSWYQMRERILTSWLSVKLYSIWNVLRYQTANGALVKITIKPTLKLDSNQRKNYEYQLLEQLVPIIYFFLQNSLTLN